jgi:predicted ATPase
VLREAWERAAAGHPSVVSVRGDPGVGNTRLVAELAASARQAGAAVAMTRCFGSSGRLPLSPVADWGPSDAALAIRGRIRRR